jgi:hypothetical protein
MDEEMLFHRYLHSLSQLSNWLTLTKKNGKVRHIEIEHTTQEVKKFVSLELNARKKSFASEN